MDEDPRADAEHEVVDVGDPPGVRRLGAEGRDAPVAGEGRRGEDETRSDGIIWVDDVGLTGGAAQQPAPAAGAEEAPAEEPPAVEAAPVETDPEPAGGGGICPIGAIALPLSVSCVALFGRRKR